MADIDLKQRVQEWKARDLREIVSRYLAETPKKNAFVCPFHEDIGPSLIVYPTHYHCYACGAHGDVFDFARNYFKTRHIFESLERLGDATVIPLRKLPARQPRAESKDMIRIWDLSQKSIRVPANRAMVNAYLKSRALTTDFQHGHYRRRAANGCIVNHITIPTFYNGKLVSTQLRAMDSLTNPKYLRYGQCFGYNENDALTSALTLPYLIISAENKAFDVLSVLPHYRAVMGAPAKYLLAEFAKRAVAYGMRKIIVVGDNDKKPTSAQRVADIVNALKPLGVSGKIIYPPDPYKDLNDMAQAGQIAAFVHSIVN